MIIRELELVNFRCFEDQNFEFPQGLVGILGPNGSGKSTVLEAITWGLYGSSTLRTNREDLIYEGAKDSADCRVRMRFELEGECYQLERRMTGTSLTSRARLTNQDNTLAESFRGVTKFVTEKLLRMNEDSFFRSVFSKQNEVRQLSSGGPEKRRQLFAKLLDIDRIKQARKSVDASAREKGLRSSTLKDQLGDLEELENRLLEAVEERVDLQRELSTIEEKIEEVEQQIGAKQERYTELENLKETISKLENRKTRLNAEIDNLEDNLEEHREEMVSLKEKKTTADKLEKTARKYKELERKKEDLEEEKDRFHQREKALQDLSQTTERLDREKEQLDNTRDKIDEYGEVEDKLQKVEEDMSQLEENSEKLREQIAQLEANRESYGKEIEDLKEKLSNVEKLGEGGRCPVCARTLGDDYPTVTKHFQKEIEKLEAKSARAKEKQIDLEEKLEENKGRQSHLSEKESQLQQRKQNLVTLEVKAEDLKNRIDDLRQERRNLKDALEEIGAVNFDQEEYQEVKAKLEEYREDYERYKQYRQETKRIPDLKEKIATREEKLEKRRTRLQEVEREIETVEFDEDEFHDLRKHLGDLRERKDELQKKANEKGKQHTGLCNEVEHLRKEIREEKEMRQKLDTLKEQRLQLERTSNFLDLFREDLLSRIRPVLSRRASELLERTTNGRYRRLDIDRDYMVNIYEDGVSYRLDRFSGGETDLANLCLRVAISELVAKRSGRAINFLVLDEVFGSQDQQRRKNILQALRNLSDLFSQIFLITHAEDVKDRMENVLLLSREDRNPTKVRTLVG